MAVIISRGCVVASQQIVEGAVRDRGVHKGQRRRGRHFFRPAWFSPSRQDVDHYVVAGGALGKGFRDGGFARL